MLLDLNGQPIDMTRVRAELAANDREPQTAQIAQIWTEHEAHPGRGLTPAKLRALLLAGERGDLAVQMDLADDMEDTNPHLSAEFGKRVGAVALLDWSVEPPEGASAAETALAAEVQEWMEHALDLYSVVSDMMSAALRAYQCHEVAWQLEEGQLMPRLTARPGRWFTVDGTRDKLLLRDPAGDPQAANAASGHPHPEMLPAPVHPGVPLRPLAWMVHRHRARSGYLARAGLLRVLAFPHLYWAYAQRDFAEFLEIYGLPLRIGKYPTGATPAEKSALLRAVTSLGHNAAGIVPMGMALEFQNAAQGARDPFLAMLQYCDASISKAILGQTLTASEGQHGTQALGNVHNEVREDIRNADCRQIERTLTEQLIRPWVMLNKPGVDPKRLPRLVLDTGDAEDMAAYAENLPKLAAAGMRIGLDWVHDKLRIPEAEAGEPVLQAPGAAPAAPGAVDPAAAGAKNLPAPGAVDPAAKPGQPQEPAATAALAGALPGDGADLVDELAAELASQWRPVMEPLVAPLMVELERAIAAGESLESFRAKLPELAAQMDTSATTERLARSGFSAGLAGAADLDL